MQIKDDRLPNTDGLTELQYRTIVEDLRKQPAWRNEADKCAGFYDGNQLSRDELDEYNRRGIRPVVINQIKPLINSVLGLEAKTRTDWRVAADNDEQQDLAEALSAQILEAERETNADYACSEGFASQVKAGIGWVSVTRNADPFGYPYQVEAVDRNEIWWDWHARKLDLSDARYLVRERWYPVDTVCAYFPGQADLIHAIGTGWTPEYLDLARGDDNLARAYDTEHRSGWFEQEWRNADSRMVCLREVWYRVPTKVKVIRLPDSRTVEYDSKNPVHVLAAEQGFTQAREAIITKLRVSIWVGPHKLQDEDAGRREIPYVPFFGYREDKSRVPYGIIRDLVPLQQEINARRSKLQWLLASKRVVADSDALDKNYNDFSDLAEEVARPDAVIVTDPNRRNAQAMSFETDLNLAGQQFQVMHDAGDMMQRVAGIFNSMLGQTDGAKSGTAIHGLVEQGNVMQAEITDNYRFARRTVGQRLLELVAEYLAGNEKTIMVGEEGRQRPVTLNKPVMDTFTGLEYRENDVAKALVKVALDDVPSTPAYRAQNLTMLSEVMKSLPPQIQAPLVPYYLESTDLAKRREMADLVRKTLGISEGDEAPDPEKQQMQAALQEMQAALQQGAKQYEAQLADLGQKLQMASVRNANKEGELQIAAAEEQRLAEAAQISNQERLANIERVKADTLRTRADTARILAGDSQAPKAGGPARIPVPRVGGDPGL